MHALTLFTQSKLQHGFDSCHNGHYLFGIVQSNSAKRLPAIIVNEDSEQWHIVNLKHSNRFDAVVVLGAFDDEEATDIALQHYGNHFDAVATGTVCSSHTQGLKRYLDSPYANMGNRPVFKAEMDSVQSVLIGQRVEWDGTDLKSHNGRTAQLLLDMVKHDDNHLLLEKYDGITAYLKELDDVELVAFDSFIVDNVRLEQTMNKLLNAMNRATGQGVQVRSFSKSKPVKLRQTGAIQVAVSFELVDGQNVTIVFNHADAETAKLGIKDALFAWKYKLNSRDISAAVQPNNAVDVKIDQIAVRIMKLANANSARFIRSLAKKDENKQALADSDVRISDKQAGIVALNDEIADLQQKIDDWKPSTIVEQIGQDVENEMISVDAANSEEFTVHEEDGYVYFSEKVTYKFDYKVSDLPQGAKEFTRFGSTKKLKGFYVALYGKNTRDAQIKYAYWLDGKGNDTISMGWNDVDVAENAFIAELDKKIIKALDDFKQKIANATQQEPTEPQPIVLTGKELGDFPDTEEGKKALRAAAKAEFEKLLGQWVECPALASKVEIRKLGLKKILSTSADTRKLEIIPKIKELIQNAEKLKTIPPYDANVDKSAKAYHILRSGFTLEGQDLFARIVVKEDVNGIFHYDHSILEKVEHELFDCMQEKSPLLNSELNSVTTSNDEGTCPSRLASHQLNFSIELGDNLVNTFDAVGDKYVLNLFIEGEDNEPKYKLKQGNIALKTPLSVEKNAWGYRLTDFSMANNEAIGAKNITIKNGMAVGIHPSLAKRFGLETIGEPQPLTEKQQQKRDEAAQKAAIEQAKNKRDAEKAVAVLKIAELLPTLTAEQQKAAEKIINDVTKDSKTTNKSVEALSRIREMVNENQPAIEPTTSDDDFSLDGNAKKSVITSSEFKDIDFDATHDNDGFIFNFSANKEYQFSGSIEEWNDQFDSLIGYEGDVIVAAKAHFSISDEYNEDGYKTSKNQPFGSIGDGLEVSVLFRTEKSKWFGIDDITGSGDDAASIEDMDIPEYPLLAELVKAIRKDEGKFRDLFDDKVQEYIDGKKQSEEQPMNENQADIDYLNSIINGEVNFAKADLDELESKLEAISERLTPETESLLEQAAEAFAQYAISLEV